MITKFDTSGSATKTSSGSGNKILTFLIIAGVAFAGYKFLLKPYLDKKKAEKENQNG